MAIELGAWQTQARQRTYTHTHKETRTYGYTVYTMAGRGQGFRPNDCNAPKATTFQIAMSANFAYSNRIFLRTTSQCYTM